MLNVIIGQTHIPTQNANIPVVLRNPVFQNDDGNIPGSFIFNFSLPLTDELKQELQFAHRPSRKGKPTWQHNCQVRFGPLNYSGTANITEINSRQVEINMPVDTGSLAQLLKNKTLKDLDVTETIQQVECNYSNVVEPIEYMGPVVYMNGAYAEDIYIEPDLFNIKTLDIYDPAEKEWVIPETGSYEILVSLRSSFKEHISNVGASWIKGAYRVFRIWKNGAILFQDFFESIPPYDPLNNFYFYKNTFTFNENDKIKIGLRCTSGKQPNSNIWQLHVYIDPETSVAFDKEATFLNNIVAGSYPDYNYTFFPVKNPNMLQNTPESLFKVDMNNLKDYHGTFGSFLNYYYNGKFPCVLGGSINNISHLLLNIFSPAIYIAFIIKKLLSAINYNATNNPFETDEIKRIVIQSNDIINNYFWNNQPIQLIDFLPQTPMADFLLNTCRTLGIVFDIKPSTHTIRFEFIHNIINDNTSIPFDNNILSDIRLLSEDFDGFSLLFSNINCDYTNKYYKTLNGINLLGTLPDYFNLPATANINDGYYLSTYRHYAIWQYDQESGAFGWVFHSIDFNNEVSDTADKPASVLKIELTPPISANYFWDPDFPDNPQGIKLPAFDNTLGAPRSVWDSRYWLTPAFYQNCNFKQLPDSFKSDNEAILLFYHGLRNDSFGNPYPFASNDVYDYANNKIAHANLSLRPDGDYGLYEKKWKSFIQWRLNSPGEYTFTKAITPLDIKQLDWFRWHKIHGVDYLLKEIRFNITQNRLSPAQITAHRR